MNTLSSHKSLRQASKASAPLRSCIALPSHRRATASVQPRKHSILATRAVVIARAATDQREWRAKPNVWWTTYIESLRAHGRLLVAETPASSASPSQSSDDAWVPVCLPEELPKGESLDICYQLHLAPFPCQ